MLPPTDSTSELSRLEDQSDAETTEGVGLTYDPASALEGILGEGEDLSDGSDRSDRSDGSDGAKEDGASESTRLTTDSSDGEAANPPAGDQDECAPATPDDISGMTEQLTETLCSANGPPSDAAYDLGHGSVLDQSIVLNAGETLSGSGTITGGLVNNGLLNPGNSPGIITVETSFSQGPEGVAVIEIGGISGPGVDPTGHDQINVTGNIALDGTVDIQLFNGFIPSVGQSFVIFQWTGTRTGDIAHWLGTADIPGNPDLAFVPTIDDGAKTLTLTVVSTHTIVGVAETAILDGLDKLQQIGTALEGVGEFAESLPFIGDQVGNLVDIGTGIQEVITDQIATLLGSLPIPRQSDVTAAIQNWDGEDVAGFHITVNGVLGHYGALAGDPYWWEIELELTATTPGHVLSDVAEGALGAVFSSPPSVDVTGTLELDIGFGYDGGFFLLMDGLTARVEVDAMGSGGFAFDLAPPGGPLSLDVVDYTILFEAAVTATPDPSILDGSDRIPLGTIEQILGIGSPAIDPADAFNLAESGWVDAQFALNGALTGFAFDFAGAHRVRIISPDIFDGTDPDLWIQIDGTLTILDQMLAGEFTIIKNATETYIEAANVSLDLMAGVVRILRVDSGTGLLLIQGDELAGTVSATLADGPDLPNLELAGSAFTLEFNSTGEAIPTINSVPVDLPEGPWFRLSGNAFLMLTEPEITLQADFVFEPRNTDADPSDNEEIIVGVANLALDMDDGLGTLLEVTDGEGAFVITDQGITGVAQAMLEVLVPGVDLSGTFSLTLNGTMSSTASRMVNVNGTLVEIPMLPAGPYLRLTGEEVELEVLGVELTGTFVVEQKTTDTGGEKVVTIGAADVELPLGSLTGNLVNVTDVEAAFILTGDGIAGQGTAMATLDVPGVTLGGTFTLRVNDTDLAVNETVDVVGSPVVIDVPVGPYLQVNGTGVTLTVLGVTLTGDFSFEQRETLDGTQLVTVVADNVAFDVGTDILTLDNGHALFLVTDSGLAGQGSIDVGISALGGFNETFDWAINNTGSPVDEMVDWEGDLQIIDLPQGPFNQFSTDGPVGFAVNAGGQAQTMSAALVLTLVDDDNGDFLPDLGDGDTLPDFVTVGVSQLTTELGGAGVSLEVADGTGAFVLVEDGIAGRVEVGSVDLQVGGASHAFLDLSATGLRVEFNNTGMDIGPVDVAVSDDPADDVTVDFSGMRYWNYLAVAGTAELSLDLFPNPAQDDNEPTLSGNFIFELSGSGSSQVLTLAAQEVEMNLNVAGAPVLSFSNGEGAFIINGDGVAGTATLDFDVGLIGLMGTVMMELNTTSGPVMGTVTNPDNTATVLNLTDPDHLFLTINDGHISIGSLAFAFDFTITVDLGNGDVLLATDLGDPLLSIDGTTGALSIDPLSGIDLSNGFDQIGPIEMVQMLRALGNWLSTFRDSDIFDIEIPFTNGRTLGEALDWAQAFADHVFSYMVSHELQAGRDLEQVLTTTGSLSLTGATFDVVVGDVTYAGLNVSGTVTALDNPGDAFDTNTLVGLFNTEFQTISVDGVFLDDLVEARINRVDPANPTFAIALKQDQIASGVMLLLNNNSDEMSEVLGFATNDGDTATADQAALETQRYSVEDFIIELGTLLTGVPGIYNPNAKQFTFPVHIGWDQDPSDPDIDPLTVTVPFGFAEELGPIGSAELAGELELTIDATLDFTIGFDLNAGEVPRVISSPLVPAPSNGRLTEDATFQVLINENPDGLLPNWVELTLFKSETDGTIIDADPVYPDPGANNSLADLATDFNELFFNTMWNGAPLSEVLHAEAAGSGIAISILQEDENGDGVMDPGEDVNQNGQADNHLGLINLLAIRAEQTDVFATEIGFGVEAYNDSGTDYFRTVSKSRVKGLFIEDAGFQGSVGVDTSQPITGSLSLGFLSIDLEAPGNEVGTFDPYQGPNGSFDPGSKVSSPIGISVGLMDGESGSSRFYVTELLDGLEEDHLANFIQGPDITGSFFAGLTNLSAGIGPVNLPTGAEISVWIPDITHLDYNPDPYDAGSNNQGIFLTFPDLGAFSNFEDLGFLQIIQALNVLVDSLSDLSAFGFLDENLPFINISISDMVDYATKFAEIIESVASQPSSSIQDMIAEMEAQIEDLLNLDAGDADIFSISLDDGDGNDVALAAAPVTVEGGDGRATATFNPLGSNNGLVIKSTSTDNSFNGVTIRFVGSHTILDVSAEADWDPDTKVLTIAVNGRETTANEVIAALAALPGTPWSATLVTDDNPAMGNTGGGTYQLSALKFSLNFTSAYANSLPFQLNLRDLVQQLAGQNSAAAAFLNAVTTFIQAEGSGVLTVSASAALRLDFGLDLTNPGEVHPFFYDTTGVELLAKVLGTDITFSATIGAVAGIKIQEGSVTLDADGNPATDAGTGDRGANFRLGLRDNNGDGRHYFDENWFDLDNIDLSMEGGVSAILPIYLVAGPLEQPLGSDADGNGDSYPDNYLVLDMPDLVRLFVETRAEDGIALLRVPGARNDLEFIRTLNDTDNYEVRLVQNGGLGSTASAAFNNNTLTIQVNSGMTTAAAVRSEVMSLGNFTVNFHEPDPPPDDPDAPNDGTGTVTTSKIALTTPDLASLFADLDMCDVLNENAELFLDGLDALLGTIQGGLEDVANATRLPLIGDGFAGAANFIDDFRSGLLADLRREISEAGSVTAALENAVKQVFWNLLGPPGLDILADPDTGDPLDASGGFEQLDVTLDCDDGLIVNLRLHREAALLDTGENGIDFDIGVPGFGLMVDGQVKLAVGFDLMFGFGFNAEDGFYFATGADQELRVYLEATIPGLTATGTLLFLQLQVADDPDAPSKFAGEFVVDLMDPSGDGKLTFAELTSSGTQFSDVLDVNLGAVADLNLDLSASFGGSAAFPRVVAEFHLGWMFDVKDGAGEPVIEFRNIALDLGTFLSDFLGPALNEIRKVTEPFQPIIDAVTARLPVLSDLAGEDITLLTLAEIFGLLEPSTVRFIESVIEVVELINSLEGLGEGTVLIPFGSFRLGQDEGGGMRSVQVLQQAAMQTAEEVNNAIMNATGPGASETYKSQAAGFVGDVGSLDNFSIPFFDNPAELFNLFIGEPVRLVEWRMPTFKFEFVYTQKIPIYPPLYAQFGGKIGATIDIGFGYDTFGIQKFIQSEDKNVLDIFDGFYIIDFDTSGNDRPELTLFGELFAGASLDLLIVEVGVRGGVFAKVEFDLNDINDDGKIRISEVIALAQIDPRCIFNIHGEIGLFLEAFLIVDLFFFSIDKTWRFAEITLVEFDIVCPEPVLADQAGGDLTLNVGSRAGNREEIDTTDGAETFIVRHVDGSAGNETVEVQWGNYKKTFEGVSKVIIEDAGQGDDLLDFRGVLAVLEVNGGVGNDTIHLGDGNNSVVHGGAGNDTITASSLEGVTGVELYGDEGNDLLTAGPSAITIHGGEDADVINGSPMDDMLFGDGGPDTITAGAGNDYVEGGEDNDIVMGDTGFDTLFGGEGNDVIKGGRDDDIIDGEEGDDDILGGSGNDLLIGGSGNDRVNGHAGIDVVIGDSASAVRVGGALVDATNIVTLLPMVAQVGVTVEGLTGSGNDTLIGGGNIDVLFGGDGHDHMYGGNFLNSGETTVIEEDANDFFDGGRGDDVIFGDDAQGRTGDRNTGIAIKSFVFYDTNLNGLRDADEIGFGGVTVRLYSVSDPFTAVATEMTESDGAFEFLGLDPGSYFLRFSLPTGLAFTLQYAPSFMGGPMATGPEESALDSDTDATGETDAFQLDFEETESSVQAGYTGPALVSVDDASVVEGNLGQTEVVFTVRLSGIQGQNVEVQYSTINGGGIYGASTADGDFEFTAGILVFAPGELAKQISVRVNADTIYEENQQFELDIVRAQRMEDTPVDLDVTTPQIFGTILNDDPIPTISIDDYTPPSNVDDNGVRYFLVPEETDATFVVRLSNPSQYAVTVLYRTDAAYSFNALPAMQAATPDGLGLPVPDFKMQTDVMLTFEPGETTQSFTVDLLADTLDEESESFLVDLYNPTFARIGDARAIGVIGDDDGPVSVSIRPLAEPAGVFTTEVMEGNVGFTLVPIEVSLSGMSGRVITVTFATSPGTAVESVWSGDTDGDGVPNVIVFDLPDYIGLPNEGTEELIELVFEPGETTKTFDLEVRADNRMEDDEEFFVNLLSAEHAVIAANTPMESNHVVVRIMNDDVVPDADPGPFSIRFSDSEYFVDEPDSGTDTAKITLIRSPGSSEAVAVFYTLDGTATGGGVDYDTIFRELVVFGENEYERCIEITIHSDVLVEGDETVKLFLRSPTGSPTTAFPNQATLTIRDGDVPRLKIYPAPFPFTGITEGSSGATTPQEFRVYLLDENGFTTTAPYNVFFDYETVSLTARAGQDFVAVDGTSFIPAGMISVALPVGVVEDMLPELSETFAVRLSNPIGATVAVEDQAAISTIQDDDPVTIFGVVFYDANGNGYRDLGENSVKDVAVEVTYFDQGVQMTVPLLTDTLVGSDWAYSTNVFLGQVSIAVDGATFLSPYQGGPAPVMGSGNYQTTTNNETQSVTYEGIVGISPFAPVGYNNTETFDTPAGSEDVGRGGTDDTIFGGPGDDVIDAGAGDDHVVGGHWTNALDTQTPIHMGLYDAVVTVITDPDNPETPASDPPLHNVYDMGPIFGVDTSGLGPYGTISGQIWNDVNGTGVQEGTDPLFTQEVVVYLYDEAGNWVNALVTTNGQYQFTGLSLKDDGTDSHYVVQFLLPNGWTFVSSPGGTAETQDNDAVLGGRTEKIAVSLGDPSEGNVDAGVEPDDLMPVSGSGGFEFEDPSYNVNENAPGYVTVTVVRGNAFTSRAVVVRTEDGSAVAGVNYLPVSILLNFNVGETFKTVNIPILDSDSLDFCTTLDFTLVLRDPTGRPLGDAIVIIYGDGAGTLSDDDVIDGGDDWDLILGDSGNIPADAVIAIPASLNNIVTVGGPGHDIIFGGSGPDYIDAQIGDDEIDGEGGRDIVYAGMGDDLILADRSDDIFVGEVLDGGHGQDSVVSRRDVARIELYSTGATTADLLHRDSDGDALSLFKLNSIELAQLFGGSQGNTFDIRGWDQSAFVVGGLGVDVLLVEADLDMILTDATPAEGDLFLNLFGFRKDAAISLPDGATYHLSSLESVTLTGGPSANMLDASSYSRPVTLEGLGGDDILRGGTNNDVFLFDADDVLGTDTVFGGPGSDTLDFSATSTGLDVDLSDLSLTGHVVVPGNLTLIFGGLMENAIGGDGDDILTGNIANNILLGGPGNDTLAGGAGNEIYGFDTDEDWGMETIVEYMADAGHDIIDFSGTTSMSVSLNMAILGTFQVVNANLQLRLMGEGVEEVIGGSRDDVLRGNSNDNILRGLAGDDILDGNSGNDLLAGGLGNDDLDGGLGDFDTIAELDDTSFNLSDTLLSRATGEMDVLDHIEVAFLFGGAKANIFNLTGWTGSGLILGGGNFDTVILGADADITLSDVNLSTSAGLDMDLGGVEGAWLSGGPSGNQIDAREFHGTTILAGGEGDDTILAGAGSDLVLGGLGFDTYVRDLSGVTVNTSSLLLASSLNITLDPGGASETAELDLLGSIEAVTLIGGAMDDLFDVSGWSAGPLSLMGGPGEDSVAATLPATEGGPATMVATDSGITLTGVSVPIMLDDIQNVLITGTEGDDVLDASGFSGGSWLRGLGGDDILYASRNISILEGNDGDDRFVFFEDSDNDTALVAGGDGFDTLDYSAFTSGIQLDLNDVGAFQTVLLGEHILGLFEEDVEAAIGGAGDDLLVGNTLDNRFNGMSGADTINGFAGTNTVVASADADFTLTNASLTIGGVVDTLLSIQVAELTGGDGNNTLDAGAYTGRAILRGGAGLDVLIGGSGSDILEGGAGDDVLRGNGSSDTYEFDVDDLLGSDQVEDSAGQDLFDFSRTEGVSVEVNLSTTGVAQTVHATNLTLTLAVATVIENLIGGGGDDILTGNAANNILWGGGGEDQIDGISGFNTLLERRDANFVLTDATLTLVDVNGIEETDTFANVGQVALVGGESDNLLDASAFTLGNVILNGDAGNDILIGGRGSDILRGGIGNDQLYGGVGNDSLYGEAGNDVLNGGANDPLLPVGDDDLMVGGTGNDAYVWDLSLNDTYAEPLDLGLDTVVELAMEGYFDALFGIGPNGLVVDLFDPAAQDFYDNDGNLVLSLVLNAGTIEHSF